MFPIPYLFLKLESGGVVPLPPGGVKKIAVTRGSVAGLTNIQRSAALLLTDGSLYTQGDNAWGECADGTTTPYYNTWKLSATNVADVFGVGTAFVVKYNDNTLKFAGNQGQLTGGGSNFTAWTNLPSSLTSAITGANLVNVTGDIGNTHWKRTDGYFYVTGANTGSCLGTGGSAAVSTPRLISTSSVRSYSLNSCSSYLNGSGTAYACGFTYSIPGVGSASTVTTFTAVNLGVTAYIKEWLTNESRSIAIASTSASDNVNYIYSRAIVSGAPTTATYTKDTTFGPFTNFRVIDGGQSTFLVIDNKLYGLGANQGVLGIGTDSSAVVEHPTLVPVPVNTNWDLSKLTYIVDVKGESLTVGDPIAHWMVYDGNLFYTGNPLNFFGKTEVVNKFTNVPETTVVTKVATAITTSEVGPAVVGGKKQLTYSVTPPGAPVSQLNFSSSNPNVMTISNTGMMTFLSQGSFSANLGAISGNGQELDDGSGGWAEVLDLYTLPIPAMKVGQTYQVKYEIGPTDADKLPDMVITYTTADPTVATVNPTTGLITAVGVGGCFIGTNANYQNGAATAVNTAWLDVTA